MKTKLSSLVFIVFAFVFSQSNLYAQFETGGFDFDGVKRVYGVFLPKNYTGTENFPLVIYLHSYGWNSGKGMNYTALYTVADTSDFLVAYPDANPNWNSGIGDSPSWPTPNINDVGFINALIDTLSNHYSIDLERVFVCGFSNGGFMAYKLACQLSHRIAAIASIGGVMSNSTAANCKPLSTMSVLHIHGTKDRFVPINSKGDWNTVDQSLNYWTNFNNCAQVDTIILPDLDPSDGCTVEKIIYTNCTDNSNIIYYKVINGGHSWPGAAIDPDWARPRNMDIITNVEIWNFFKDKKIIAGENQIN